MRNILIINTADQKDSRFVDPIASLFYGEECLCRIIHWESLLWQENPPSDDLIYISASPKGNNQNFQDRIKAFEWLKYCEIPVLGICAGHQLMAVVFGARLISDREAEEGEARVRKVNNDPLFNELPYEFVVEQHHRDSVNLAKDFILLASSEKCKVQAVKHKKLPLYSVQWHAERSSTELIRKFAFLFSG